MVDKKDTILNLNQGGIKLSLFSLFGLILCHTLRRVVF